MMVSIHIKSDSRKRHEAYVLDSFRKSRGATMTDREAAEVIAARSREAYQSLRIMEEKKNA